MDNRLVLRIAGASYSGSTALGHFLNTGEGVVFGSELYRLLPASAGGPADPAAAPCDACGMACTVWTPALRAALQARPQATLADIYQAFFDGGDDRHVLVDGSKSPGWYRRGPPPAQPLRYLVSVRHPLRLAASHLLNDAGLIPASDRDSLARAHGWLAANVDTVRPRLAAVMRELAQRYAQIREIVDASADPVWCRCDDRDALQAVLERLGHELGCRFEPGHVAGHVCHAVGGNRSLSWQLAGWQAPPLNPVRDQARFAYYRQRPDSGFLADDKHRILLAPPVAGWAVEAARAEGLFELLGYAEDAP